MHAEEVIALYSEEHGREICFQVVGVVDLKEGNFVLLLPEAPEDPTDVDHDSPILILEIVGEEFLFITDEERFKNISEKVSEFIENYRDPEDDKKYIDGEPIINTFLL